MGVGRLITVILGGESCPVYESRSGAVTTVRIYAIYAVCKNK